MTTPRVATAGLEFWNRVCRTDPRHTKRVEQRGGFTAIDAYYQIENATREWGPAGGVWRWEVDLQLVANGTLWLARVSLFHPMGDHPVVQFGCKGYGKADRPDEDAPKKAVTDGLTKCLSYLGFNADVFLGKFDDSKYVESVREQIQREESGPEPADLAVKILERVNVLHGDKSDCYVAEVLEARKVKSVGDLPLDMARRWLAKLDSLIAEKK
jgi:hypothetical protein